MNSGRLLFSSFLLVTSFVLGGAPGADGQGLPPLGQASEPKPAAPAATPAGKLSVEAANADLKTARAANQEKRYADAEALMLRDTALRSDMPYLWIELGQAQLGEKKYDEAEASFKAALNDGSTAKAAGSTGGFYAADGKGTHSGINISDSQTTGGASKRSPEIEGMSDSALGEIYIHAGKVPEAKAAFDEAAKANPSQAPLYYRNEAVFFLQVGNAPEQVAAADKAIAVDPTRAVLYFYKGQGLAAQATVDAKTQKLTLPAGCGEALQKYLDLDPTGPYVTDAKGMLTAAGIAIKAGKK
jgi:tetratricopeptide (TPR) repeat protein